MKNTFYLFTASLLLILVNSQSSYRGSSSCGCTCCINNQCRPADDCKKVGVIVGVICGVVGFLVLISICLCVYFQRRRRERTERMLMLNRPNNQNLTQQPPMAMMIPPNMPANATIVTGIPISQPYGAPNQFQPGYQPYITQGIPQYDANIGQIPNPYSDAYYAQQYPQSNQGQVPGQMHGQMHGQIPGGPTQVQMPGPMHGGQASGQMQGQAPGQMQGQAPGQMQGQMPPGYYQGYPQVK